MHSIGRKENKKKKFGRVPGWKETYIIYIYIYIYIMIHYYDDGNGKKKFFCFVLLVWCVPHTCKRFSKIYNNIFFVIMI